MKYERIQRVKYVKILELLRQESDEDRPLTTSEILRKLHSRGIAVDRKILYEDIKVLNETGYEIMCNRAKQNEYFIANRQFDVPELRILMDAVQAASFIPEKMTDELIQKIANLGGSYRKRLLLRDSISFDTHKHSNKHILYSINEIEEAINDNKKISFMYFDLDNKGNKVFRKERKRYETNPVALLFNSDNYYLVSFSDKYDKFSNYRVDRMESVNILAEQRTQTPRISEFDANQYRKQSFGMYAGEPVMVTLEFDYDLIDVVFDKFGERTNISDLDGVYSATVSVIPCKQFFAFLIGLGGNIKLVAPEETKKDFVNFVSTIKIKYERK